MPTKKDDGFWHVYMRPSGVGGRRFRKKFAKKHEAVAYENWVTSEYSQLKPHENGFKDDKRRLSELVDLWFEVHGNTLRDKVRRKGKMDLIVARLGDPIASKMTAKDWSDYRAKRLMGDVNYPAVKSATVNREQSYLRAVFSELESLGQWSSGNPLMGIKKLKESEIELTYYNKNELEKLFYHLSECNSRHVPMVAKVCLAVGARWEEAATLSRAQVKGGRITLHKTKSGKRRIIPISSDFEEELLTHEPHSSTRLFSSCLSAFRRALVKSGLPSPEGQLTHVLRHSFAVWFMEQGGNLVDLMNTLGHSNIQTTAIYLRFAPTHLESVPKLNPLAGLNI